MTTSSLVCFNRCFFEANRCKTRYRILMGGAGSGKSVNIAQDFILKLMNPAFKGANLLVVRRVEQSNKNSTFSELSSAAQRICKEKLNKIWNIRESALEMECLTTGNRIIFRGLNDAHQREKIKSINFSNGKLTWIWVEEATEISQADFEILDDRLRGVLDNPSLFYQITLSFNPVSSNHWIKSRFFECSDPEVFTHHSTYLDNCFIDSAYHTRMERRKKYDPEGYRVYALGEWGSEEGLIIRNFTVCEFEKNYDSCCLGQDFGFNHANAILSVGFKDGNIYVDRELYEFEKDTSELIKLADGLFDKKAVMYCDSAEPDRIKMWRKAGYNAVPVKKGSGSVLAQIDYLKQHKIIIHPSCKNLIAELKEWKWKSDGATGYLDIPNDFFDDAIAALRYAVAYRITDSGISFLK